MVSTGLPAIVLAAVWAQVLPAAALLSGRNRSRPVVLVGTAFLFAFVTDWIGRYVGRETGNSLWLSMVVGAPITVMYLVGLADWQISQVEGLAFRLSIVPYLLVFTALVFWVEDASSFSQYAYPFSTLVVLGAAVWTLLRRSLQRAGLAVAGADWFLISLGLALNAATTTISSPIAAVLMAHQRVDLVVQVWEARAVFVIISLMIIAAGALRPPAPQEAGP